MTNRSIIEEEEKWYDLAFKIPFLKFKPEWEVRIQPPFNGAMVRFRLRYKGNEISVYLDCYERLGCFGAPYWEMYPYKDDVARFALDDAENLIAAIDKQFNSDDWIEFYKKREEMPARRKALIEKLKNDPIMGPIWERRNRT